MMYTHAAPGIPVFRRSGRKAPARSAAAIRLLKQGIWLYFLLLIFEGALRKWFLPFLSTPLLIVRDPIALWLVVAAWKRGLLGVNLSVIVMVFISVIAVYTAFFLGHGSLPVAVYGARITLFHFPLIFVIAKVFDRSDVEQLGKVTLWTSMLMAVLIALQFFSPQSAWVNRGLEGSSEGAGFSGAMGYFRPPGTFSFTNGTSLFFGFVACYICYFWLSSARVNKLLLIGSTVSLIMAIPLSISRGLFLSVGVSLIFALMAISRKPKYLGKMILAILGTGISVLLLNHIDLFRTATTVLASRFEVGNQLEGGMEGVLLDRYLGGLIGALNHSSDQPFFGYGMGMGTNVGSMLLTGRTIFLISEGEWGRIIGELGPIMGISVVLIRLSLSAKLLAASYQRLAKGDLLPWMLLSFGLLTVPQGGWAQPTSLGFCTVIAGLILAACRRPKTR
ncbi:MAG TPA: hypothetical protein VGD92_11600 [Sphingobacteriaceae bacterium]